MFNPKLYNIPYHTQDLSKYKFLITGGAGFIGSNIVEYLIKYNAGHVRVLDNLSNGYFDNIKDFMSLPNFEFILGFVLALLVVQKIRLPIIPVFSVLLLALMSFFYCIFTHLKLFAVDVNLLFAIVAFLSIFIVTSVRNFKINKESVLMLVGNATYSIYIIHNPLQMILTRFFPKINSIVSVIVALVLALIFSCVLGFGYYLVFKKKAIHLIKSKLIK